MDNYFQQTQYDRAKKRVQAIRSFYYNVACYCTVIPFLIYLNLTYNPEFQWFWFSACGWGIGLLFHGLGAFNYVPFLGPDWEQKKIRELMEKEKQNNQPTKL